MKILFLILLLMTNDPLQVTEDLKLIIPSEQYEIFPDYSNNNFSQKSAYHRRSIFMEIKSSNFYNLNLNYRVVPRPDLLTEMEPEVKAVILSLFDPDETLKSFMSNISHYLRTNISYSDADLPQDAVSVIINRKANCIGFSNTVRVILRSAGVHSELVRGFYLKNGRGDVIVPIPHRWVEIQLPGGVKFFYDPQYQEFSVNYIATKKDIDFKQVRRFKVNMLRKSRKFGN